MPENKYVISAKARADLKAIAKYTIEKFGEGQSLKYAQGFKTILADLADNPELGRRYVAVKDKMLSRYRYKAHVIFYYVENGKIFIVRVLGGRMDFPKHLK
ncbi:type II toxin-antitoxin system RelE/ParE family toxin [Muricauda ruestringensis]|uniref:Toxin n=1 Tax=Flagellimonas aurea TaxID=2915619 RepID=A0ABS3G036_9FLAO|nr:type II toxin-antitoxin system RelE/ParE family toxin [Allomuricauda aurea]MAO17521.1 plasmid stabilization protein [Allomuricauda sp.]MBC71196.1 plasmid stabilization protein [Allomuricauda sp.]MBO0352761.1 type II toxin-antitoxin system RelE/ParE family toxin [Allomuricauda aurea]|tara:strand:+ start:5614 stop:5916 length:303 start_codon:yes stop_codon:yes gene_type:complete